MNAPRVLLWVGGLLLAVGRIATAEPDPNVTFVPLGQNSYRLDWTGEEGWTYFSQWSVDLENWSYLPEVDQGVVHDPLDLTPVYWDEELQEYLPYPGFFVRLKMSDFASLDPKGADYDGDGLSNWAELNSDPSTDPLDSDSNNDGLPDGQADTDSDGLSDQWELMLIAQGPDPSQTISEILSTGDDDGDGVENWQEYQNGLSGYQTDSDGDGYGDRLSVDLELDLQLDEQAGLVAADSSGHQHDGQLTGPPSWQPAGGIGEGALQFNGNSDRVELPGNLLDGAYNLTISLWFKTSGTAASRTILSSANDSAAPELAISLEQTTVAADTIRFDVGGGAQPILWVRDRSLADNRWHHLVLTRDFTASASTLYLDGAAVGTEGGTSYAVLNVDTALVLGQRHSGLAAFNPASAYTGLLDEVRIYSAVLDPNDPLELFRPNDLDLDGLPDDWELSQVQNLATLAGAADDLDGDGLTNRAEFEGGTNPNDYYNGVTPQVALVDGSGQSVYNGQRTERPLVFKVTSDGTTPLVGAPVTLQHLAPLLGSIETVDGDLLATSLTLKTDAEGKVAVHFKAD